MTAWNVVQTAILPRRIVQSNPTGNVCDRFGSGPIRVILMPEDYSTVMSWFGEDLIVPETNRALEHLRSRNSERRVPKNIVKTRSYPPGAQCVKKHLLGID